MNRCFFITNIFSSQVLKDATMLPLKTSVSKINTRDKEDYKIIVKQAMKQDFSWDKSCEEYIELYKSLLK